MESVLLLVLSATLRATVAVPATTSVGPVPIALLSAGASEAPASMAATIQASSIPIAAATDRLDEVVPIAAVASTSAHKTLAPKIATAGKATTKRPVEASAASVTPAHAKAASGRWRSSIAATTAMHAATAPAPLNSESSP